MPKKKVTFAIDNNVYGSFRTYCEKNSLVISDQIEGLLLCELNSKGVKVKNYPTLQSFFKVFTEVKSKILPQHALAKRDVIQKEPVQNIVKHEIVKKIPLVSQMTYKKDNPKVIMSKGPVPTIDQLRSKRGI